MQQQNSSSAHRRYVPFQRWLLYMCYLLVAITFPISLLFCFKIVREYERAVILRLGRVLVNNSNNPNHARCPSAHGPGLLFILPCVDSVYRVDLRTITFDVDPQEVLTNDSVTVTVDAVVYYRVFNPLVSVINVANVNQSTRLLAQTTLRNVLGTKSLSDILLQREEISKLMQEGLDSATEAWGVQVERVEIKDVRLPKQLQRAMAAEAEASREARAKVIAADGELQSIHSLKQAADVLKDSVLAVQLRYLQTLTVIATEKPSTIIFPVPMNYSALL